MSDNQRPSDDVKVGSHLMAEEDVDQDTVLRIIARFALKSMAWIGIYFLGYFDFSIAWMITPLILSVLRDQWKKEKRDKLSHARISALTNEKSMIESRIKVEDLPSWVFFPDKDRAEWLNSIISQLWPNIGHYTRQLITETIEPAVKSALDGYSLTGFKFEKVVLGQVPPRITGIKVYDKNTDRNEIIMDMDVVLASDCDIKFSLKRLKAKISDFSLRGLIRVVFKPLTHQIPLIGGIQVYFLTQPEIDFDLGGIANALDAPGLSNIIRKIVLEQIGYFMVLPNKFTMPMIEGVENKSLKCPDSAGVLRVKVVKAANLVKKDIGVLGMGKSDPFVILTVGSKKSETPMIKNTVNPEWNYTADFPIEVVKGQQLTMEIWDHDDPGDNEFLGRATIQTNVVADRGITGDMWIDLEDIESGKIMVNAAWLPATTNLNYLSRHPTDKKENLAKCILHVFIDSCKGIEAKKPSSKPSPICELTLAQESQSTWPQYFTNEPVYEQGFVFLVANPDTDDLKIKIIDTNQKRNDVLGFVTIRMSDLLRRPGMEYANMPFTLKGSKSECYLTLAAQIKCLKDPKPKNERPPSPLLSSPKTASTPEQVPLQPASEVTRDSPSKDTTDGLSVTAIADESSDEPMVRRQTSTVSSMVEPLSSDTTSMTAEFGAGSPAIDEVIGGTISPLIGAATGSSVDMDEVISSGLRQRSSVIKNTCGKIKVSMSYNTSKEKLKVFIHQASNLPGSDLPDPPDPYVKLYILPERNKKSKRKSDVIKDTTNPIYDEEFEYEIPLDKLGVYKLEISVVDKKGIFAKSPLMGRVVIDLMSPELDSGYTDWYVLEEEDDDSD